MIQPLNCLGILTVTNLISPCSLWARRFSCVLLKFLFQGPTWPLEKFTKLHPCVDWQFESSFYICRHASRLMPNRYFHKTAFQLPLLASNSTMMLITVLKLHYWKFRLLKNKSDSVDKFEQVAQRPHIMHLNVLSFFQDRMARRLTLFFYRPKNHKIGRGLWVLASCQVLANSIQQF